MEFFVVQQEICSLCKKMFLCVLFATRNDPQADEVFVRVSKVNLAKDPVHYFECHVVVIVNELNDE